MNKGSGIKRDILYLQNLTWVSRTYSVAFSQINVFPFVTNRIISYVVYLHWAKNASLYKYTVNLSVNLWVSFISKTNSLPFLCRNTGGRLICQTDSNIYGNLSQHKTVSKCTLELYKLINLNKRTPKTSAHSQHAVILENTAQAQFTES